MSDKCYCRWAWLMGVLGVGAVCGFVHGQWVHMGTRVSLHVGQVLLQVGLAHGWDSGMVRWA
jgi:hypothetical protein